MRPASLTSALAFFALAACGRPSPSGDDAAATVPSLKPPTVAAPTKPVPRSRLLPHLPVDGGVEHIAVVVRAAVGRCLMHPDWSGKLEPCARFEIENTGNADVDLDYELVIEKQSNDKKWIPARDVIKHTIAEDCPDDWPPEPPARCATLRPKEASTPYPWFGWHCNSRCKSCSHAVYPLESGTYRAVARSCDRAQTFTSSPFVWTQPP